MRLKNKFYHVLDSKDFVRIPEYIQSDTNLYMCIRANFNETSRYPDYYERIPAQLFAATMQTSTDFVVLVNPDPETLIILKLLGITPDLEENTHYAEVFENVYVNTKSKVDYDKYIETKH